MGGEYTPMILSPQWIISFEKNIWNIIWNSCWVGFFPVSTKMKAQWACANIRWVKILYYFISLCKNPWWVYGLLIIFSTSGFPVIIKFQPATCNLQPAKNTGVTKTQTPKTQTSDLRPRKLRPRKLRPRKVRPRKLRPHPNKLSWNITNGQRLYVVSQWKRQENKCYIDGL